MDWDFGRGGGALPPVELTELLDSVFQGTRFVGEEGFADCGAGFGDGVDGGVLEGGESDCSHFA